MATKDKPPAAPAAPAQIAPPIGEVRNAVEQLASWLLKLQGVPTILAALQTADQSVTAATERKAAVEAEIASLTAKRDQLAKTLQGKDDEVKAALGKLTADLDARQAAAADRIALAEKQAHDRVAELDRTLAAAEREVTSSITVMQANAGKERQAIEAETKARRAEVERLTGAVAELRAQLTSLKAQVNQVV